MAIRPAMLYATECQTNQKTTYTQNEHSKDEDFEMMTDKTMENIIENKCIHKNLGVAPIGQQDERSRWFSHVQQKITNAPVRSTVVQVEHMKRIKGRPQVEEVSRDKGVII